MGYETTKLLKQIHEQTMVYLLFGAMGHHALAGRSTSLGWGSYGSMEMEERSVGGLRDKGSQGIHGQHNSMQGKSCLRVTPIPLFIAFLGF